MYHRCQRLLVGLIGKINYSEGTKWLLPMSHLVQQDSQVFNSDILEKGRGRCLTFFCSIQRIQNCCQVNRSSGQSFQIYFRSFFVWERDLFSRLPTETFFYSQHSLLNPFVHSDRYSGPPSLPPAFLPSNPRSHFPPLQRIHCWHNWRDVPREVFLPWSLTSFSLSVFSSLPSSHDIPHVLLSSVFPSIWLIPLGLFLSLPPSLCIPPPPSRSPTCNQCSVDRRYDWT